MKEGYYTFGPFTYTATGSGETRFECYVYDSKGNQIDYWNIDDYWNNVTTRN